MERSLVYDLRAGHPQGAFQPGVATTVGFDADRAPQIVKHLDETLSVGGRHRSLARSRTNRTICAPCVAVGAQFDDLFEPARVCRVEHALRTYLEARREGAGG